MLILPAIDLLDGRCVRLRQGRFDEATVHSDDPVAVARAFEEQGAEALHVVDLDGARLGKAKNIDWIFRIRDAVSVPMQVAGGIRTFSLASRLFDAGIDRIALGTAAAEDPRLLEKLLQQYEAEHIAAALDIREGKLVISGRESESVRNLQQVLSALKTIGIRWVVCTDVTRDGILIGPSFELAERLVLDGFQVIISGGIATVDDIARIRATRAAGCIIGSALYGGLLTIETAKAAARGP